MKLTEEKLKQMIMEEIGNMDNAKPEEEPSQNASPEEKPEQNANPQDKEKAKVNSVSKLKAELVDLSKNITKVPGLDPNEINLMSGLIATMLKIASSGNGSTIMKRVYDVLQKNVK